MNGFSWLQLGQWLVGSLAILLLWSLRAGIRGGQWLSSNEALKAQLDRAGQKTSDLASYVQGLGERLRKEADERYMSVELSEERWSAHRREMDAFDERLRELELQQARIRGGHR